MSELTKQLLNLIELPNFQTNTVQTKGTLFEILAPMLPKIPNMYKTMHKTAGIFPFDGMLQSWI